MFMVHFRFRRGRYFGSMKQVASISGRAKAAVLAAITGCTLFVGAPVAAQQVASSPVPPPCIVDWSEAAPIVMRERLAPARHLQEMARVRLSGDIVRITLCREDDRFVYRLLLRDDRGRISNLTVDARQPFAAPHDR